MKELSYPEHIQDRDFFGCKQAAQSLLFTWLEQAQIFLKSSLDCAVGLLRVLVVFFFRTTQKVLQLLPNQGGLAAT